MSIHSSLKISAQARRHRSVLKRIERLRWLNEKEKFEEGDSVFGLPKIKSIRIKFKKEKVVKDETEVAAAEGAATEAAAEGATPAKEGTAKNK